MATSRTRRSASSQCCFVLALVLGACAGRGQPVATVRGTPLSLRAADGRQVELAELARGQPATVLVFWSASCPCVHRYQQRVDALAQRYPADRVRVLAISSNAGEPLAKSLAVATERGMRTPLWRDEGGAVAAALGARSTPTAVVLDGAGNVRFVGWVDNEREPGEPGREPWLERAVHGVLDGTSFSPRTRVFGCPITRAAGGATPACCADNPQSRRTSP